MISRARGPAWLWLAAIVVVSTAVHVVLVRRMPAPWIMVDELIYSELGKSFAADGSFLVRGVPSSGYGFVYPILVAPAFRLYSSVALAVLIPSMLYTGTLMTENVFYPVFVLAALMLVLTLERPTALRQVLLLAVCGLAFATRAQAVALFGAALVAPILHGFIERDVRRVPRRFATLYGLTAIGAALALVATVARGRSPLALLGAYRAATDRG